MDPFELQGVMRTIGQQSNAIQALKDELSLAREEIQMLRDKLKEYEPQNDESQMDSGEVVHSNNGAHDFALSDPSNGSSR